MLSMARARCAKFRCVVALEQRRCAGGVRLSVSCCSALPAPRSGVLVCGMARMNALVTIHRVIGLHPELSEPSETYIVVVLGSVSMRRGAQPRAAGTPQSCCRHYDTGSNKSLIVNDVGGGPRVGLYYRSARRRRHTRWSSRLAPWQELANFVAVALLLCLWLWRLISVL